MNNTINHLAIIMDGNGRWAKLRGLDRNLGHREGLKRAEDVIEWSMARGVKYISLYVFSTENWKRPKKEVDNLFKLASRYISNFERFCKDRIRVVVSGERDGLPEKLLREIDSIETKTRDFDRICVNLLINYGARQEIISAISRLTQGNVKIDELSLLQAMYRDLPEPDMVIRTGGQQRMSNFMLFQCAYSELFFTDTLWPDFNEVEFDNIIAAFNARVRNFGGLKESNDK